MVSVIDGDVDGYVADFKLRDEIGHARKVDADKGDDLGVDAPKFAFLVDDVASVEAGETVIFRSRAGIDADQHGTGRDLEHERRAVFENEVERLFGIVGIELPAGVKGHPDIVIIRLNGG